MEQVKSFEIKFDLINEQPESFLPFSFQQLKQFVIHFPNAEFHPSFNEQFFNFIDKHPKISHISIKNIETFRIVNWSRLSNSLPLLFDINLSSCWLTTDEAIELMDKFQMLKKFHFKLSCPPDTLLNRLNKIWEMAYNKNEKCVKLLRTLQGKN